MSSGMEIQKRAIDLLQDQNFRINFRTDKVVTSSDTNGESESIVSQATAELPIKDMDSLLNQVIGSTEFDLRLKASIAKSLGDHMYYTENVATIFLTITYSTPSRVKLAISGEFFDDFLSEFKKPVKLTLKAEIKFEDQIVLTLASKEMSPSLVAAVRKGYVLSVFEDEIKLGTKHVFQSNQMYFCKMTMEIIPVRAVEFTTLQCNNTMCKNQNILKSEIEWDFEIIAENGCRFKCHKVFLAINSPVLAQIFQTNCSETKEKAVKVQLSEGGVKALLKFIYYASVEEPMKTPNIALELLDIGCELNISNLVHTMKDILNLQENEWFDINIAILLYLRTLKYDGNRDLRWKALQVIKSKADELGESSVYRKLLDDDSNVATRMVSLCLQI